MIFPRTTPISKLQLASLTGIEIHAEAGKATDREPLQGKLILTKESYGGLTARVLVAEILHTQAK